LIFVVDFVDVERRVGGFEMSDVVSDTINEVNVLLEYTILGTPTYGFSENLSRNRESFLSNLKMCKECPYLCESEFLVRQNT
tara:strand:+ start:251 stop:496 length:246 start_codon:yes stop_codon:yes gene_type:complete